MLYHRAPAFVEVYARALERLKLVFQTRERRARLRLLRQRRAWSRPSPTWCAPASPRWWPAAASSASAGPSCATPTAPTRSTGRRSGGAKVEPAELDRRLAENDGVEVVFTTLSETSTGVVNDVRELTEVAHRHGALIAVDAVSGIGAVPLPQDEWGVDVVVSGSQKALMSPPGPRLRQPQRGGARARRRGAGPALLLRLGPHRRAASARTRRTARSRPPSAWCRRSTWRSG